MSENNIWYNQSCLLSYWAMIKFWVLGSEDIKMKKLYHKWAQIISVYI